MPENPSSSGFLQPEAGGAGAGAIDALSLFRRLSSATVATSFQPSQRDQFGGQIYNRSNTNLANLATQLGYSAIGSGNRSTAVGSFAYAREDSAVALGVYALALGPSSVAIGDQALSSGYRSITIGNQGQGNALGAISIGFQARALGVNSIAIGSQAYAIGANAISIGASARTVAAYSIALGALASVPVSNSPGALAIGANANVTGAFGAAIALGAGATVLGTLSPAIAIGSNATVTSPGREGIAIGTNALVSARGAQAYGEATTASFIDSVAFGRATITTSTNQMMIGNPTYPLSVNISGPTPWVDVIAYGATGNGTTNDFTFISNALAAATGDVYFPPGTYRISSSLTIASSIRVIMAFGAMISVDTALTLTINGALDAGAHQIFTGVGTVLLGANSTAVIDPIWFGAKYDGTDDQPAIQKAIDAVGPITGTVLRSGKTIRITGIATIASTIRIEEKSVTFEGTGAGAISTTGPSDTSALIWNGSAASGTDPMVEVKNTYIGTTIRNLRFYGKTANKPRAAISFVNGTGYGTIQYRMDNVWIGCMPGDTGYDSLDTFVDGIRVGDTYDSGDSGNNDGWTFEHVEINGCTGKGIRIGSINNLAGVIRNSQILNCAVGLYAAADTSLESVFFGASTSADIHVPALDDFSVGVESSVNGLYVASESSTRFLLLDGQCNIYINDGYWSMIGNTLFAAGDQKVILADNGYLQSVVLRQFKFRTSGSPPWSIVVKNTAGAVGVPSSKVVDIEASYPGAVRPTFDVDPVQPFQQTWVTAREELIPLYLSYPQTVQPAIVRNSLLGTDTYDAHRYDIPVDSCRIGERVNGSGTTEVSVSRTMLTTTGAISVTATGLIPANSLVIGVTANVYLNTGLTGAGGAATVRLGTAANPTKWWTQALPAAANTEIDIATWNLAIVGTSPYYTQTAEDVVLSVNAGTFNAGGKLLVTAHYINLVPSFIPPGGF